MAAKVTTATVAILLFFLFTFSYASVQVEVDQPKNDVIGNDGLTGLPESDPKSATTILLPSDNPDTEPVTVMDLLPDADSKLPDLESELEKETESESEMETVSGSSEEKTESQTEQSVPLTVVTFHPINRHFHKRPLFSFRHGHRCRHHHKHLHQQLRAWSPRLDHENPDLYYGNDMILSGGEDLGVDPAYLRGVGKISGKLARFHHDVDMAQKDEMKKPHHEHEEKHEHEHHHHHHRREHDEEEEKEEYRHDHHHREHDEEEEYTHDHHHHRREHDEEEEKEEYRHDHHHREHDEEEEYRHDHHHREHHGEEKEEYRHEHRRPAGLMNRIRKFLNHF